MLCGCGSFSRVDEGLCSLPTPRASRRKRGCSNPYAARGIDKFSKVLADLQARRNKVMAQEGGATSHVPFVCSNSHDWIPIVLKVPPREQPPPEKPRKYSPAGEAQKKPDAAAVAVAAPKRGFITCGKVRGLFVEGWGWHPSYYWPAVVALILLCLVFGRSFAICCTSIGWYLLPCSISGDQNLEERKSMKKHYRSWAREKKPVELAAASS